MKPWPLVIADDEPLARDRLRHFLEGNPEWEIVGMVEDGLKLQAFLRDNQVALVLLDIRMPGLSGFEAFMSLPPEKRPEVIFVSAYDHVAVKAFEIHAVDYILKPFERARLEMGLAKALSRLESPHRVDRYLAQISAKMQGEPTGRIALRVHGKMIFVEMTDIRWIGAAGNYLELHYGEEQILIRQTLTQIQKELGTRHFLRIHRSTIVNVHWVAEWHCDDRQDGYLVLKGGKRLNIGRRYRGNVMERLFNPEVGTKGQLSKPLND